MEQSDKVIPKNAEAANERERLLKLDGHGTSLSADLQQALLENATEKNLLKAVKTAFALQKMGSQQRILSYVEEQEKLVAKNAAINAKS